MRKKIYFLPGTMCNEELWTQIWEKLDRSYELIHIPIPTGNNLGEIVAVLKDQLPNEKINIVGFSLGGYIAASFAGEHCDRVNKLLIISNSPCKLPEHELIQRKQAIAWAKKNKYQGIADKKIQQLVDRSNWKNSSIFECIKRMERSIGLEFFLQQVEATTDRVDLSDTFRNYNILTTFCFGDSDALVNHEWMAEISSLSDNVECIEIPNAGHMLPLEKPDELAGVINQWGECE